MYNVTIKNNSSVKTMFDIKVLSPRGTTVGCWSCTPANMKDQALAEAKKLAALYNK